MAGFRKLAFTALAPVLASQAGPAASAELNPSLFLRASNASKAAIEVIAPVCAANAGVSLRSEFANNPEVAKSIEGGAPFDVVVVESGMLGGLADRGLVDRQSVRPFASLAMSIATREPGPYPRIETVSQFRKALLRARSIGYIGNGHSGTVFLQVVDRINLRAKLAKRLFPFDGAYAEAAEASSKLQYVVAPFNMPLPVPLRLVGKFPAELNADVRLSAGASPTATPGAAQFLGCMLSAWSRRVLTDTGYDLPAGR